MSRQRRTVVILFVGALLGPSIAYVSAGAAASQDRQVAEQPGIAIDQLVGGDKSPRGVATGRRLHQLGPLRHRRRTYRQRRKILA
jgi:hypothetical protein